MIVQELLKFLDYSEKLRHGFKSSIGYNNPDENCEIFFSRQEIPTELLDIYKVIRGTNDDIPDQTLFDFFPGYRILQARDIELLVADQEQNNGIISFLPFMENYSSDYFGVNLTDGNSIYSIQHADFDSKVAASLLSFFKTLNLAYEQKALFLDKDDYLACEYDLLWAIGRKMNPNCNYWE